MCGIFKLLHTRIRAHDQLWCCNQHWGEWAFLLPESRKEISLWTPQPLASPPCTARPAVRHRCYFWGPGRSCARAAGQEQPALHLCLHESCTAIASSPGFSLLLYWKGSAQQPINYRHLTYSAKHPAGYFESHCPLRQITGSWTWHLMTCSYFDCALILLAVFNATQVFQLTEVILWISCPGYG